MSFRKRIENSLKTLKYAYQKLGGIEIKRVTALLVIFFMVYYAIEGFGRTVITEFRIPQELQKDLVGVDGNTLTQQLIVDLQSIRVIQETAKDLKVDLVRGLESLNLKGDPLEIKLSGRINTDYRSIIENVGTLEWGPLQIPAALLLRPFQKVIRQEVMQLTLQRIGDKYRIFATSDGGGVWQITEEEAATMYAGGNTSLDTLSKLIRVLAYKIAYLDGIDYQPQEITVGFYHFHQGIRHLLDYYDKGELPKNDAIAILEKAVQEFEHAIRLDPKNIKSRYNLIMTSLERSFYLEDAEKVKFYQGLLKKIKDLQQRKAFNKVSLQNLLLANYILLADAYSEEIKFAKAIATYQIGLKILNGNPDLQAYILNNIGVLHQKIGLSQMKKKLKEKELEEAIRYYKKSLEYNPHYARAYLNLGNVLTNMGEYTAAERAYAAALEKRPEYISTYYNFGYLYRAISVNQAFFEQLDHNVRTCLQEQALVSLKKYISFLEGEEITRNLSEDEKGNLLNAKSWLHSIGTLTENTKVIEKKRSFGYCLREDLTANKVSQR